ncbi:MAG: O-antigen ligase family protein, partial [Bacteroidota bacterium]
SYSSLFASANCIIGIVFIIGVFVDPGNFYRGTHGGTVHRLGGFIINPNELGMLAVLGMVAVNMEFVNGGNRIWNGITWGVCFAVLLLTQSRSSLGAWLMVTGYFVMVYGSYTLKAGMIAGVVLGGPVVLSTIVFKDGNVEEVMSMTGRLPFWRDLITDGLPRRPYIGMGFMRIDYHDYFDSIHAYAAKMTHNTFVQVIINLGLIGAWICLWQMIYTFYAVYHSPNKDYQSVAATMLVPIMINSFTEFGIFGESNYGIMFYQIIIMMFTIRAVRIRPGPDP